MPQGEPRPWLPLGLPFTRPVHEPDTGALEFVMGGAGVIIDDFEIINQAELTVIPDEAASCTLCGAYRSRQHEAVCVIK